MVPRPRLKLVKNVLGKGAMGKKGLKRDSSARVPDPSASLPSIGHRERSVATCFIRGAFRNIWIFTPPVPSARASRDP
ncbi:hypothetical protein TNIN_81811 [Trichonephila inaurata madagascariensis]|uniref:Uncharacterized protein n=1 Tax=Trichonephila inaurata madagascariensis TaxID=2747483 RepID=A0A8X6YDA3_9ARAC|nr:hypothetical protein TNIN_81811 [Trichonephila inaurata madagascariensis]